MSSESLRASANSDTALFYVREKEWLLAENFKNCSDLGTFKRMSNSAVTPLPTSGCIATNESFQMRYFMNFYLQGNQNYCKENEVRAGVIGQKLKI